MASWLISDMNIIGDADGPPVQGLRSSDKRSGYAAALAARRRAQV
jgi:hypothetical protein